MKTKWTRLSLLGALLMATAPGSARADSLQDNMLRLIRKVGVHGNMGFRHPTDSDVTKGRTFGPSVGLSPGATNGWKYPVALSMYTEDLHGPDGSHFGSVRSRSLMGGIGYGWHFGRLSVGPQVEVGYSFNHGTLTNDAPASFGMVAPGTVTMDVKNAWVVRPEVKAEFFVTQKVTFRTSLDYVRTRPDIVVSTPQGVMGDRWDMSNVHANVGIGFYPFRK